MRPASKPPSSVTALPFNVHLFRGISVGDPEGSVTNGKRILG